jgi:hypothetical protein
VSALSSSGVSIARVFRRDTPSTRSRSTGSGGGELQPADKCGGECSTGVLNAFITEVGTSARSESKRMTNHNTSQLSGMDSANHCAAFPGLSRLNTRAVRREDVACGPETEHSHKGPRPLEQCRVRSVKVCASTSVGAVASRDVQLQTWCRKHTPTLVITPYFYPSMSCIAHITPPKKRAGMFVCVWGGGGEGLPP